MKKLYSLIAAFALAAFTFTSCEDVPAPYDTPEHGGNKTEVEAKGDGTQANPFNIAGILEEAGKLEKGASSSQKYYFTGIITSIKECGGQYGNATFYVGDGASATKTFYVYRCMGIDNQKITDDNLIHVGDSVVVYGTVTNYNGTLETEQKEAYIVSINGNGGTGGGGGGESGDALGKGTKDDPYNIAAANNVCAALQKSSTSASYLSDEVYVKGKVSKIVDTEFNAQYKNITYFISEDGSENSTQIEVYRGFGLGGAKFNSLDDIKVGDEVIVCGKLQNWLGTYEFTSGAYLYSLNGKVADNGGSGTTEGAEGDGTQAKPYNVIAASNLCAGLQKSSTSASYLSDPVYVKGKVSSIVDTEFNAQYQNITYYISDDGKETGTKLEVYRGFGLGGAKFNSLDDIKVGDEVIVYGKLQNWLGTYEFTSGSSLYSLNGKVDAGGTGDDTGGTTGGDTGSSEGLSIDGTTVTLTNSAFTAGTTTATIDLNAQGWENAAAVTSATFTDGATVAFSAGTNTTYPPKFYTGTKGVRCYSNNTLTFTGKSNIAKVVMDCDEYNGTKYVGSAVATVSFNGNSIVYTNVNDGKNTQLRVKTITIYYAQ